MRLTDNEIRDITRLLERDERLKESVLKALEKKTAKRGVGTTRARRVWRRQ